MKIVSSCGMTDGESRQFVYGRKQIALTVFTMVFLMKSRREMEIIRDGTDKYKE